MKRCPLKRVFPKRGDEERNALGLENVRLVGFVMGKILGRGAQKRFGMDRDDFLQEGYLGLLKAAGDYDPERLVDGKPILFNTCAVAYIKSALYDAIAGVTGEYPRNPRNIRIPKSAFWESAEKREGQKHRLSTAIIEKARAANRIGALSQTYDHAQEEEDEPVEISDFRPLYAALALLDEREHCIMRLLYWDGLTYRAAGEKLGITRERVRQIRNAAFKKLRRAMAA